MKAILWKQSCEYEDGWFYSTTITSSSFIMLILPLLQIITTLPKHVFAKTLVTLHHSVVVHGTDYIFISSEITTTTNKLFSVLLRILMSAWKNTTTHAQNQQPRIAKADSWWALISYQMSKSASFHKELLLWLILLLRVLFFQNDRNFRQLEWNVNRIQHSLDCLSLTS